MLPLLVKGEKLLNNDQRRCLALFLYSLYGAPSPCERGDVIGTWSTTIFRLIPLLTLRCSLSLRKGKNIEKLSKTMFSLVPLLTLRCSLSLWKGRSYSLMEWDKKIPVYWNIFSELASFPIIFTFCVMIIPFSPFKKPGFLQGLWCLVLQIVKYKEKNAFNAHLRPIIKISSSYYSKSKFCVVFNELKQKKNIFRLDKCLLIM